MVLYFLGGGVGEGVTPWDRLHNEHIDSDSILSMYSVFCKSISPSVKFYSALSLSHQGVCFIITNPRDWFMIQVWN